MNENTGRLSTHVLDNYSGKPASGIRIDLSIQEGNQWKPLKSLTTNADGRTDELMLTEGEIRTGYYELCFHLENYYQGLGLSLPNPPFLTQVPIRFNIFDAKQKYHVPLLVTPWSFSTYRGS